LLQVQGGRERISGEKLGKTTLPEAASWVSIHSWIDPSRKGGKGYPLGGGRGRKKNAKDTSYFQELPEGSSDDRESSPSPLSNMHGKRRIIFATTMRRFKEEGMRNARTW